MLYDLSKRLITKLAGKYFTKPRWEHGQNYIFQPNQEIIQRLC